MHWKLTQSQHTSPHRFFDALVLLVSACLVCLSVCLQQCYTFSLPCLLFLFSVLLSIINYFHSIASISGNDTTTTTWQCDNVTMRLLLHLQFHFHFHLRRIGAWCSYACRSILLRFFSIFSVPITSSSFFYINAHAFRSYIFASLVEFGSLLLVLRIFNCNVCRVDLINGLRDVFLTQTHERTRAYSGS